MNGYTQQLGVPTVGQENLGWCVQACVRAILAYYKVDISQCELKEFQRTLEHWRIVSDNCCANPNNCGTQGTYLAGAEGAAEDALNLYGSIKCEQIIRPLTLNEIVTEISNGRPFIIGKENIHAVVCYGINGDNLQIMNPSYGGYTETYSYSYYTSICTENLLIKCINQIELHGELNMSGRSYKYEAAQSFEIYPTVDISNVEFYANVSGSTECQNLCLAPSCQIILDGSDSKIKLHVRNGQSYSYELYRYDGVLIKNGSGTLTSNDQVVSLCDVAITIYIMKSITITSNCETSRTLKSYKIPLY